MGATAATVPIGAGTRAVTIAAEDVPIEAGTRAVMIGAASPVRDATAEVALLHRILVMP